MLDEERLMARPRMTLHLPRNETLIVELRLKSCPAEGLYKVMLGDELVGQNCTA